METKRIKRLNQITLIAFIKNAVTQCRRRTARSIRRNKKEQEGTRRNKKYNVNEYSINK